MKTRLSFFVAAGLALLLSALGSIAARADNMQGITDTTIKIGNMGPYTGDASSFSALNYGPMAYFRYINSQGGVHGRKFESVTADGACKETTGIAAAKRLIVEERRRDRHGHATARRDQDHEHLVLVDQLLGRGDAGGLLARVVGGDDLELASVDKV